MSASKPRCPHSLWRFTGVGQVAQTRCDLLCRCPAINPVVVCFQRDNFASSSRVQSRNAYFGYISSINGTRPFLCLQVLYFQELGMWKAPEYLLLTDSHGLRKLPWHPSKCSWWSSKLLLVTLALIGAVALFALPIVFMYGRNHREQLSELLRQA